MGRTIPSFRMLINAEVARWKEFRNKLAGYDDGDKMAFDEVMRNSRLYASASSCALRTSVFEGLCMAILLDHQNRLEKIATELERLHLDSSSGDGDGTGAGG